jgi:hypothetical protein
MGKFIVIFIGLTIGLIASFYYISGSLSSLSPHPTAITVEQVLSLTTHGELQDLRATHMNNLAEILERVEDAQTARQELSAAQHSFMQLEMINTRVRMLPAQASLQGASNEATVRLRNQCTRLNKMPFAGAPLRTVLDPLSSQLRVADPAPFPTSPPSAP